MRVTVLYRDLKDSDLRVNDHFRTEQTMSKKHPTLSPKEQRAMATEAVKRMNDTRQAMASSEARENYLDFMTDLITCEVGYKTLLKSYLNSRGNLYSDDNLTINPNQIPHVLKHQISSSTKGTSQQYLTSLPEKRESAKHTA